VGGGRHFQPGWFAASSHSGSGKIAALWDTASGKFSQNSFISTFTAPQFSPDSTRVVTVGGDNCGRVWDAISGAALMTLTGHEGAVDEVRFSLDGSRIVTASDDATARVWDSASVTSSRSWSVTVARYQPPSSAPMVRTSSPRQTNDCAGMESPRAKRIREKSVVLTGTQTLCKGLVFSPDNSRIVTASDDGSARVWDATSVRLLATLTGHRDMVLASAIQPRWPGVSSLRRERIGTALDDITSQGLSS